LPKNIFPEVPAPLFVPTHPVIVKVFAVVQDIELLAAKLRVCVPVPRANFVFSSSETVENVSEKPAVAPVFNVPPLNEIKDVFGITSDAPKVSVPPDIVVPPE
jgi:hypothetical protein